MQTIIILINLILSIYILVCICRNTRSKEKIVTYYDGTPPKFFKPYIDRSTEEWLSKPEKQLDYKVWYCGHYHIDKEIDKINMMYSEIRPLHLQFFGKE